MNCPICNKVGLPDYTIKPVICPQCNSDLKGFMLIKQTSTARQKSIRKQKVLIIVSVTLIIMLLLSLLVSYPTNKKVPCLTTNNDSIVNRLNVRLKDNEATIKQLETLNTKSKKSYFLYIIKRGDNLSKIANIFYNNPNLYKKIAKANSIEHANLLFIGDTLKISLKKTR